MSSSQVRMRYAVATWCQVSLYRWRRERMIVWALGLSRRLTLLCFCHSSGARYTLLPSASSWIPWSMAAAAAVASGSFLVVSQSHSGSGISMGWTLREGGLAGRGQEAWVMYPSLRRAV